MAGPDTESGTLVEVETVEPLDAGPPSVVEVCVVGG
jgi:hypothetical protein